MQCTVAAVLMTFDEVATTMEGGIDEALDEFGPATAPATQAEPQPTLEDDEIPF